MIEEASAIPAFRGAYTAGSANWLSDDAELPATSDLDVMVVVAEPSQVGARRKFLYHNVLLEVSYLRQDQFRSPEQILSDYHLAPSFRTTKIMVDPLGLLAPLWAEVCRNYAKRHWVRQRGLNAKDKVLRFLNPVNGEAALHDEVLACLFAAGVTNHMLLVAGLKNPTVRTRYRAVKELLTEYGHTAFYERLLNLLGATRITRERASQHLDSLARVFDEAKMAICSPFPFACDVSNFARAMTIEGTRDLIERDYYREAMFWVGVTHSRCQKILSSDAPGLREILKNHYYELTEDLGLSTPAAVCRRRSEIRRILPEICQLAEAIVAANPELEDGE
jgi:hypothetical protein